MHKNQEKGTPDVLDSAQLVRIEAVHRGFLYQHLYSVGCLMLAQAAGVEAVVVELDEDIELLTQHQRIYVQVKTRSKRILPSDISGALSRFEDLRKEHAEGRRTGRATFVIVANQAPSVQLQQTIDDKKLPPETHLVWPQCNSPRHPALPPAWKSLSDAAEWCVAEAEKLNFSLLAPDSLIWKLAGLVQLAATGSGPSEQHTFHTHDLPRLFEQLIVQLQDFPAPPESYRPQRNEPTFTSGKRVRIICGLSGAGKTAWAAQAARHSSELCAYYDTGDLPGPALASALVRELAAKFATRDRDGLRRILLPGASGYEALRMLDTFIDQHGSTILLVLDNAHRIPVANLRDIFNATKSIRFVLLCQPHDNVRELESITGLHREALLGWDIDTVAAAVDETGGFATAQGYEQLRTFTGGLPLYVQSAAKIAVAEYAGNIDTLCVDLRHNENSVETAQEVILSRVYHGFEKPVQESLALLSLADVGLSLDEISSLLIGSLEISKSGAATLLKKMRATGTLEVSRNQTLKVHDAVRALGTSHLELMGATVVSKGLTTLKNLLVTSLHETRDTSRLSLLTQVFLKLNDVMTLIAISGEELFYEMGIAVDILSSLEHAVATDTLEPVHKFWALDGLVFAELKEGPSKKITGHLKAMNELLVEHKFGYREEIAYAMKMILSATENGDALEIERIVAEARPKVPDAEHMRVFDYNHAIALWKIRKYKDAETLCAKVIDDYYTLLGIRPQEVIGKNSDVLWTVINRPENVQEHIKHLADALELFARIREAVRKPTHFLRIHAMKFYNMAGAAESMVRLGQDLADEFVSMKEYDGAKEVLEQHVLPVVNQAGLIHRLVQVRSQYAVVLALCGQHEDAAAEMDRLNPYTAGLSHEQRQEVENQKNYIKQLEHRYTKSAIGKSFGAVRRNEICPCGSGLKYKKCHGA